MPYHLKLKINDPSLVEKYRNAIEEINKHNQHNMYQDSGFDLFVPGTIDVKPYDVTKLDHMVSCAVFTDDRDYIDTDDIKYTTNSVGRVLIPSGYYLYPRSSISKTPLRLANSVGIIDSGYRGHLIAMVDCFPLGRYQDVKTYTIEEGVRLMQICSPDLTPFASVEIVDDLDETTRGNSGFGSTGR